MLKKSVAFSVVLAVLLADTAWALMESLKAEVAIAKNELKAVNAKLKKICSAKPKPKGC